jgi:beta-galactosidase
MGIKNAPALLLSFVALSCHKPATPRTPEEPQAYLFSYFSRNGEDGVHLAYSHDGINWTALNGGRAIVTPQITGSGRGWQEWNTTAALMRDPSILRGPDGVFHLVWTVAWTDHAIGVAHSRDLVHWSEQTRVPVMEHEPNALNTWAPDLFYDDAKKQFVGFGVSRSRIGFDRDCWS